MILSILITNSVEFLYADQIVPQEIIEEYRNRIEPFQQAVRVPELLDKVNSPKGYKFPFIVDDFPDAREQNEYEEIAAELMGASLPSSLLSCHDEIKISKKLPSINFVGEAHPCPNCNIERCKLILDAQDNKIVLATEDSDYCEENDQNVSIAKAESSYFHQFLEKPLANSDVKIYGLDNFSRELSDWAEIADGYPSPMDPLYADKKVTLHPGKKIGEPVAELGYDEVYRQAFSAGSDLMFGDLSELVYESAGELANSGEIKEREFYKRLRHYREEYLRNEGSLKNPRESKIALIQNLLSETTYSQYQEAIARLTHLVMKKITASSPELSTKFPKLSLLMTSEKVESVKWNLLAKVSMVPMRNRDFAIAILDHYCNRALPNALPLKAIMGSAHIPGVKFLLQSFFTTEKVPLPPMPEDNLAKRFLDAPIPELYQHLDEGFKEIERHLQKMNSK